MTTPKNAAAATADSHSDSSPAGQLAEIQQLIETGLPMISLPAAPASLGNLGQLWSWLAGCQHKPLPSLNHPRIALFLAAHGVAPEKQQNLPGLITAMRQPSQAVTALATLANADLQIYEMDLSVASVNFTQGDAMTIEQALQTLAYGMMSVQPGVDLLSIALPNPAAEDSAVEIRARLKKGVTPFDCLVQAGGMDIAAAVGAMIAARLAHIPVILDGIAAEAARDILEHIKAGSTAHTRTVTDILPAATALPLGSAGSLAMPFLRSLTAIMR